MAKKPSTRPIALPSTLPPGVKLTKRVGSRFIRSTISDVTQRFFDPRIARDPKLVDTYTHDLPNGGTTVYMLLSTRRETSVYWVVMESGGTTAPVAAGELRYRPDWKVLEGARAAVLPAHQRRGIYQFVLRGIRAAYRRPLVSSFLLSPANARLWAKVGAVCPKTGRYRINPALRERITKGVVEYVRALIQVNDGPLPS